MADTHRHAKTGKDLIRILEPYFTKNAPWQIREDWRKNLVNWIPWINLILGIVFLPAALTLLGLAGIVSIFATAAGWAVSPLVMLSGFILFVSIAILIFTFPGMRAHRLSAWKVLFWAYIIYFVHQIVYVIGSGLSVMSIFNFAWASVGIILALYILFQIKHYYK